MAPRDYFLLIYDPFGSAMWPSGFSLPNLSPLIFSSQRHGQRRLSSRKGVIFLSKSFHWGPFTHLLFLFCFVLRNKEEADWESGLSHCGCPTVSERSVFCSFTLRPALGSPECSHKLSQESPRKRTRSEWEKPLSCSLPSAGHLLAPCAC